MIPLDIVILFLLISLVQDKLEPCARLTLVDGPSVCSSLLLFDGVGV
jgi:hypothetical protein